MAHLNDQTDWLSTCDTTIELARTAQASGEASTLINSAIEGPQIQPDTLKIWYDKEAYGLWIDSA